MPFSACALFLYSDSNDMLTAALRPASTPSCFSSSASRSGQGLTGWVARNRRPLVNARPSADLEAMNSDAPTELQSALVCPLIFGDRFIGTLAVYHTEPSFYRDDHRRLLDRVCEQAAAVINNSIVFEQTQEDSLTDPLTGLPNTRFMFMHLTRELARADRLKSEVSLLVMDLNDFKDINDNHGHHIGDRALRAVPACCAPRSVRTTSAFATPATSSSSCCPDAGREEAEDKRIELQAAIDARVRGAPGVRLPLSISAGAAVFPHDGDSYESLLAKADSRMYRRQEPAQERPGAPARRRHPTFEMAASPLPRPREPSRLRRRNRRAELHASRREERAPPARRRQRTRAPGHYTARECRYNVPIGAVSSATPRSRLLWVDLGGHTLLFRPGQAVMAAAHGRDERRPYSIGCSPERRPRPAGSTPGPLEPGGEPGSHLSTVKSGGVIDVEGPLGQFTFPEDPRPKRVSSSPEARHSPASRDARPRASAAIGAAHLASLQRAPHRRVRFIDELRGHARERTYRAAPDGHAGRQLLVGRRARPQWPAHFQSVLHEPAARSVSSADRRCSSPNRWQRLARWRTRGPDTNGAMGEIGGRARTANAQSPFDSDH